ncbi:hypothetical protein Nepgr_024709 [Nepenthes gracilis]|uniref:Uncharacterized protein n=1 Tax=Nepenthes gracilis TaxID=150966 RepID=A0AAD3T6F4_NEPGR|nr:hypothetical protein Nepgr_024709 [Nepenthes gracilis]
MAPNAFLENSKLDAVKCMNAQASSILFCMPNDMEANFFEAETRPSLSSYTRQLGNCLKNSFDGWLAHTTILPIASAFAVMVQPTSIVLGLRKTLQLKEASPPFNFREDWVTGIRKECILLHLKVTSHIDMVGPRLLFEEKVACQTTESRRLSLARATRSVVKPCAKETSI